jgi:hypothetical protein
MSYFLRYSEISTAATEIHSLVQQNLELFGMEQEVDSSHWLDYVGYVDNIIYESLLKTVGCRYVLYYITCKYVNDCESHDVVSILQGSNSSTWIGDRISVAFFLSGS